MNGVGEIYRAVVSGLDHQPAPGDLTFAETWEIHTRTLNMVGTRFFEKEFGAHTQAANEVRMHIERHWRVAHIAEGMPLTVSASAVRGLRTFSHYLEETSDVEELQSFINLNSAIADLLGEYVAKHRGRAALPVMYALSVVAKSAALMSECVNHELKVVTYKGL